MLLTHLSNEEVLASLRTMLGDERRMVVKVIAYLAEVEDRRLHVELASSSLFDFCVRRLGMSEGAAFRRMTAARLVRKFPRLLDSIASGRIHLSSVVLLRDHLTAENVDEFVEQAAGKSKREVQELIARRAPKPDVRGSIRKLPDRGAPKNNSSIGAATLPLHGSSTPKPQIEPLSEARYKVQLTASAELRDKLEHARELLRHRNPSGDLGAVVEQALDVLIERLEREKLGKAKRPRESRGSSKPAHITRAVRREVVERDGLRCSFVSHDGERCPARGFLELDHRTPRALGGTGDAGNVRILCRLHNRFAAEQVFGREHVAQEIQAHMFQRKCPPPAPTADATPPVPTAASMRDRVGAALVSMGFRPAEAHRAIDVIDPDRFDRPIETLLREALGALT